MALRDEAGNIVRWYGTNIDIDDRKRAEDALRRNEAYLAEAQRLSVTGSFGWRVTSGDVVWSEETYRIFGLDRTVKPTIDLVLQRVHPDDRELVRHEVNRVAEGSNDFDVEHRLLMPNGLVKYLRVRSHRMDCESGDEEIVGAVMDITAATDAQEALHAAQAELAYVTRLTTLGEMGASIAHEVNQPLAAIVSNAEACLLWLDRETPNLDRARRSVELIIKDGNRAGEVIRSIRALSNKADSQRVPLDINDVINEVIALVRRELLSRRVSLRIELAPALPVVLADRVQIQQVIINLVMNGIEAMQPVAGRPRELLIQSYQDEAHQVQVTVKDCGVGISPETADRLFKAFFTTKSSGMGMGLSICRSIITAHGGRLWAEPNLPQGATFHFTLPSHQEDAP
jgi:C4-dicarboxylate-specific signal transduction histidine kinase